MHSLATLLCDLYIVKVNTGAYKYLQLLVTETGTLSKKSQCILISQKLKYTVQQIMYREGCNLQSESTDEHPK